MSTQYFHSIDEQTENKVWKQFDKTREEAKKDIEAIRLWLKTQSHLPDKLNDRQIQSFLLIARGSVERCKPKIDMYFTMRSLFDDIFTESHPLSQRMLEVKKHMYIVPLPKLSADYSRILVFRIKETFEPSNMDPIAVYASLLNVVDIRLLEDFCSGHTVLFDLENCKFGHITRITPSFVKNAYTIGEKALTTRVHGIHLLNSPKFFDQVIALVKSIVKPKLASKIFLHKNIESVLNSVDRSILPRDYGGNEKCLEDLEAELFKKYENYKNFFDDRENWQVNEDLRPTKNINDDILGYYGNFKKLDVD